jgi:hypothetical protein
MLHAILLRIFKYLREIFFVYMGKYSQLAEDINALAKMYGKLFTHQSDRDLPNTNFAKGIRKGKLMAKEYRGVLLVMAAVLRSTMGRQLLFKRKRFGGEQGLSDWTLLVELMLEWESYLNQKSMRKAHVKRLGKKHRFIMYIMKNVAKRSTGMGLKLMKFHSIIHLVQDMLINGVPCEFDTGSNESHHKPTKHAAKLTQRNEAKFNFQTATRLTEFHLLELAMEEVAHGLKVWEYFDYVDEEEVEAEVADRMEDHPDSNSTELPDLDRQESDWSDVEDMEVEGPELVVVTDGTRIKVFEDPDDDGKPTFKVLGRSKHADQTTWMHEVVVFLNDLQNKVIDHIPDPFLPVLTRHKRGDTIFHGHPNHRGNGPWKDWAVVDWGPIEGKVPAHIWCFICVRNLPTGKNKIQHGGIDLKDGVYAVVETAKYDTDLAETTKSDLFMPLLLNVEGVDQDGDVTARKFYLADTEAIVGPCIVIPDIGGAPNAYFQVKSRSEWSNEFITWLNQPHTDDVMEYSDEEEEPNE